MNLSTSNLFTNDTYRLLCLLQKLQTTTCDGRIILNDQEDIARQFHVSKSKLNPMMQNLVKSGCIEKYKQRKGYRISKKGQFVIAQIKKIDDYKGGNNDVVK